MGFRKSFALEVFENTEGHMVIRQDSGPIGEEQIVVVPLHQVEWLKSQIDAVESEMIDELAAKSCGNDAE
jgi:ubiquinone biosynthesis protein UbiJ